MVSFQEKIKILIRTLFDSRLRMDIKALKFASHIYLYYAWELLSEFRITDTLRNGSSVNEICKKKKIKNKNFLEAILKLLAGNKILTLKEGIYRTVKEPTFKKSELTYLEKYYPASVKWTNILKSRAKKTLLTGKRDFESSFDHKSFLNLWDNVMAESPWSFRKIAIKKFLKFVKEGDGILDLGCGSGVSLEQIIRECDKKVNITGIDASISSLEKAKKRLSRLKTELKSSVAVHNIENTKLIKYDLTKGLPDTKKYRVVFMSLLLNHIPEKDRYNFFKNISNVLMDGGLMVIYQILNKSDLERAPMWVMHVVPTHKEYPFKERYLKKINSIFSRVYSYFDGVIVIAMK